MTVSVYSQKAELSKELVYVCVTYQKLQQSVGPIYTIYDFIHVLHWSFTKLLHHEENIDQKSAKDLAVQCFRVITELNKQANINV